jgi:AraC-like DNA-binding protein
MAVIATLLPNDAHLQRVRIAVRDRHELVACMTWAALRDVCETRPVRLVIADLFASGTAAFDGVRVIKRRWPRLTFIMYSAVPPERVHDAFDAGRQGVDVLVVADHDDTPRALLAHIERAEARSLTAVLRESLQGVDELVQDAVLLSVSRAHERLSPDGLAKLLALPRRTVSFRLEHAGFPSPRRLLTWGRLIMAANLMEDPNRAADRVAASLGFPSASAFRNMCQRYLHSTPSEIRRRGGASYAVRALLRHVRPATQRQAGPERPASRAPAFTI